MDKKPYFTAQWFYRAEDTVRCFLYFSSNITLSCFLVYTKIEIYGIYRSSKSVYNLRKADEYFFLTLEMTIH